MKQSNRNYSEARVNWAGTRRRGQDLSMCQVSKQYLSENPVQIPFVILTLGNIFMAPGCLFLPIDNPGVLAPYFALGALGSVLCMVTYEVCKKRFKCKSAHNRDTTTYSPSVPPPQKAPIPEPNAEVVLLIQEPQTVPQNVTADSTEITSLKPTLT